MSLKISAVALVSLAVSGVAHADYQFSGSGPSGILVAPTETWAFNADSVISVDGRSAQLSLGRSNDWGSPGVGAGTVAYGESEAAYGMIVTFSGGGTIDPASIATGNASACAGSSGGGTTFCTIGSSDDIWEAFLASPDSIEFLAQSPAFYLQTAQNYFVNVFFDGATPTSFTGAWLTSFTPTVPEPASLALLGVGVAALGLRRRMKSTQAA